MRPFCCEQSGWVTSSEGAEFPKRHQLPLIVMQIIQEVWLELDDFIKLEILSVMQKQRRRHRYQVLHDLISLFKDALSNKFCSLFSNYIHEISIGIET